MKPLIFESPARVRRYPIAKGYAKWSNAEINALIVRTAEWIVHNNMTGFKLKELRRMAWGCEVVMVHE